MENLFKLLFTGFGAAIIAAIFSSTSEIGQKFFTKIKKLPAWPVIIIQYSLAAIFIIGLAVANNQFSVNPSIIYYALISALLQTVGIYLTLRAITIEDFSLTLPFLALTPVFLIPIEFIFFQKLPASLAMVGILTIVGGSFWLNFIETKKEKAIWRLSRGSFLMILVALLYSLAGSLDKFGAVKFSVLGYLCWLYIFVIFYSLLIYYFSAKNKETADNIYRIFLKDWLYFAINSLIISLASLLMTISYLSIMVNYSISIKRASYLIPILLGPLLFKEKHLWRRLPGVLLMLGGAIIIIIFG